MKLAVEKRTVKGKLLAKLRKQDIMPAIIYANHIEEPIMVQCRRQDFVKAYKEGGRSTVIELRGDGVEQDVLIHEVQIDPVTHQAIHADFIGIKAGEEIETEVSLVLTGKAPVVTSNEIRIQPLRDALAIKAKPKDLPHEIQIDISGMENEDDVITIKDIDIPNGVTIMEEDDVALVRVLVAEEETLEELEPLVTEEDTDEGTAETQDENKETE